MEQHKYHGGMTHSRVWIWRPLDSLSHPITWHSLVTYPEAHLGQSMLALLGTSESPLSSQAPGSDSCPLLAASHILAYTYTACLPLCHQLADSPSQRGPSPLSAHCQAGPGTAVVRTHADHTVPPQTRDPYSPAYVLTSLPLPNALAKNKVKSYQAARVAGCKEGRTGKFKRKLATGALAMGEILTPHRS